MKRRFRAHLLAVVGVVAVLVATMGAAGAQPSGIVEIPLGTVIRTDPGVQTLLASVAVPADLVGQECDVQTQAQNNSSVHPGNDLVVASGAESVVLSDVEGSPGKVTTADATVTLGDNVSVTLIMGPDGVFSAGASAFVVIGCSAPVTTTTTTTVPVVVSPVSTVVTSTLAPTTTAGPTSTSVPPVTTTVPPDPPTLAVTGPAETLILVIAGIVLLDFGYLACSAGRPANRATRND